MSEARIIKKYGNRRLYDTAASGYVNLEGVAELVRSGVEVQVVDAKSGEDLTRHVLTQIIVDDARNPEGGPPVEFLRDLVRAGDQAHRDFLQWYLGMASDAYQRVQEVWRERAGPTLKSQGEAWANILDPFGAVRTVVRATRSPQFKGADPEQSESEHEPGEVEESQPSVAELAELRRRLEELESRLTD